jgi:hypothetical protein
MDQYVAGWVDMELTEEQFNHLDQALVSCERVINGQKHEDVDYEILQRVLHGRDLQSDYVGIDIYQERRTLKERESGQADYRVQIGGDEHTNTYLLALLIQDLMRTFNLSGRKGFEWGYTGTLEGGGGLYVITKDTILSHNTSDALTCMLEGNDLEGQSFEMI